MRRIFSNIIPIFTFPLRLLKKSKIDNFVGGLIFGALFSLFVNIVTVQIQENIKRQRVLEAIEHEIVINTLRANTIIESDLKMLEDNKRINYFYVSNRYSYDIWRQSSDAIQYTSQLEQEQQLALIGYYTYRIGSANMLVDKTNEFIRNNMKGCYEDIEIYDEPKNKEECDFWNSQIIQTEIIAAQGISGGGFEVLEIFHPTKDRLRNPFLKLMMGDKSVTVLSGDWKQ